MSRSVLVIARKNLSTTKAYKVLALRYWILIIKLSKQVGPCSTACKVVQVFGPGDALLVSQKTDLFSFLFSRHPGLKACSRE